MSETDRIAAIEWIEANLLRFAKEIGGATGLTTVSRYAVHVFEGLAHVYAKEIAQEHDAYFQDLQERST